MTGWMRTLHKWFGLVLALQFVLWMASGLMMSLLDPAQVEGSCHQAPALPARPWPASLQSPARIVAAAGRPVQALATGWLLDRPVYRLGDANRSWLVAASDGRRVRVDAATVRALAQADYRGPARARTPVLLSAPTLEARGAPAAVWRVDFADGHDTSVYVSAEDGSILQRRNRTWRLFDVFWMLHIMDYTGRKDFNNPLAIMASAAGVWIALTGLWLLPISFRWIKPRSRAALSPAGSTGALERGETPAS